MSAVTKSSRTPSVRASMRSPKRKPEGAPDWRDETLSRLRAIILTADPDVLEEVKWRRPSNPDGVPVWSHDGILCLGNTLKAAVRLTFPQGARLADPRGLFNTRLDSKTVRAIDFGEGAPIDEAALREILRAAARLNSSKRKQR